MLFDSGNIISDRRAGLRNFRSVIKCLGNGLTYQGFEKFKGYSGFRGYLLPCCKHMIGKITYKDSCEMDFFSEAGIYELHFTLDRYGKAFQDIPRIVARR